MALTSAPTNAGKAANPNSTVQQVQFVDAQDHTINDARILAAAASSQRVAIVVWGGDRTLQQEAYNAARDLNSMGIETAFVLAPDHNSLSGDAVMQTYADSLPRSDAHWGINNSNQVRADMRQAGLAAYREAFPERYRTLQLRQ